MIDADTMKSRLNPSHADNTPHEFELFALSLLLCTPSSLNRAWIQTGDLTAPMQVLDRLNFSDDIRQRALDFMTYNRSMKGMFDAVANLYREFNPEYDGPDPHPDDPDAGFLVAKMKEIQGSRRSK